MGFSQQKKQGCLLLTALFLASIQGHSVEARTDVVITKIEEEFSSSKRVGCAAELNGYHFNLKELSLPINEEDRTLSDMYQLSFQDDWGEAKLEFNLCEETAARCPDLWPDYANLINGNNTCNHLSRVVIDGEQKPGVMSLISDANPGLGVIMSYEGGNMCNETSAFSLSVQINCNPNLDKTTFAFQKDTIKTCDPRVIMNSPHACPVMSAGPLAKVLEDSNYWLGFPLIAIGAYLCFVSGRYTRFTLGLFSTLTICLVELFMLFIWVLPHFSPTWTVPLVFFVTFGMGLGMGYGAAKWYQIGVVIMGLCLGSLFGLIVYYAFIQSAVDTTRAKALTVFGAAVFSAVIYSTLLDYMVIITSSIFGSYLMVRGLSMFTGGYVNEFTVAMATNNGDIHEMRLSMYFFWVLMVLLAAGSIKAQLNDRKLHIEAYNFKPRSLQYESTRAMREQLQRFGRMPGQSEADLGYDQDARYNDFSENEDQQPLNHNVQNRRQ